MQRISIRSAVESTASSGHSVRVAGRLPSLSGPNGFVLSSVTSNERQPDNDVGNDITGFTVGTPSTSGFLRAERSHRDRIYTLVYTGSDVAGNQASCTAVVKVARHHEEDHDRDHDSDHDREHDKEHHAEDDKP